MSEKPINVKCPSCGKEFALEDAVLGSVREHLADELQAGIREREKHLLEREERLRRQTEQIDDRIEDELKKRTAGIEERAARKASEAQETAMKALREELDESKSALSRAREQELEFARKERQLAADRERLEIDVQKRLIEEREKIREQLAEQAEDQHRLKLAEKDQLIEGLREQMDILKRKADQGSMERQGEVLELDIENRLRSLCPFDQFASVPKGIRGADLVQTVVTDTGSECGSILFETKRTKTWSNDWIPKLKRDLVTAKSDVAVLITETLPAGIDRCGLKDGVWVVHLPVIIPLVHTLRWSLQQVARATAAGQDAQGKQAILYQYFTGNEFRNRVETIVMAFTEMRAELEREKRSLTRSWAKREKHLDAVIQNMSGMHGDIQGIAGNAVESLELLALDEEEAA